MNRFYDYVIVGAGAAGCVLANRLSRNPKAQVLLVEAGGFGFSPISDVPLGIGVMRGNRRYDWCFATQPEPFLHGRRLTLPQGRGIGGSSAINGMVYVRGRPSDFDEWANLGNHRWAWRHVAPYFERAEKRQWPDVDDVLPIKPGAAFNALDSTFVSAGGEAGFPRSPSFNQKADGFGYFDFNIQRGRRHTGWCAHLRPVLGRRNLKLMVETTVSRILFRGKRAVGLEAILPSKRKEEVTAGKIVLCGGAIGSPKLLLLSGIGDPRQLQKFGIEVVEPLVGVGRNLQNHPDVALRYNCKLPITLHSLLRADRIALAWAKALLLGSGPASVFPGSAGAFIRSNPHLAAPDLECHLVWAKRVAGAKIRFRPRSRKEDNDGFSVRISLLQPSSRGCMRLASPDVAVPPLITHNYLESPADCEALMRGIRLMRHIVSQSSFDALRGEELEPGVDVQSDSELNLWVRQNLDTQGHPVGTCRMGHDSEAVVDEGLAVRGIEGMWVADASVMPIVPGANTYATTVMIAERAADLVKGTA